MVYVRRPRERKEPAPRNDELQPPKVGSKWWFWKKGRGESFLTCTEANEDQYVFAGTGCRMTLSKKKMLSLRKKNRLKMNPIPAHADTLRWREVLKRKATHPPRDSSPCPESVETPYTKVRCEEERIEEKEKQYEGRCAKWWAKGFQGPLRKNSECRTAKTKYPLNGGHFNKLFFERDILQDKLTRRNDEIAMLRAKVTELGGEISAPAAEDSDSDSEASSGALE